MTPFGQKGMKIYHINAFLHCWDFRGDHTPGCDQSRIKFTKINLSTITIKKIFKLIQKQFVNEFNQKWSLKGEIFDEKNCQTAGGIHCREDPSIASRYRARRENDTVVIDKWAKEDRFNSHEFLVQMHDQQHCTKTVLNQKSRFHLRQKSLNLNT